MVQILYIYFVISVQSSSKNQLIGLQTILFFKNQLDTLHVVPHFPGVSVTCSWGVIIVKNYITWLLRNLSEYIRIGSDCLLLNYVGEFIDEDDE